MGGGGDELRPSWSEDVMRQVKSGIIFSRLVFFLQQVQVRRSISHF